MRFFLFIFFLASISMGTAGQKTVVETEIMKMVKTSMVLRYETIQEGKISLLSTYTPFLIKVKFFSSDGELSFTSKEPFLASWQDFSPTWQKVLYGMKEKEIRKISLPDGRYLEVEIFSSSFSSPSLQNPIANQRKAR